MWSSLSESGIIRELAAAAPSAHHYRYSPQPTSTDRQDQTRTLGTNHATPLSLCKPRRSPFACRSHVLSPR
jgi:hypothetical protein